MRAGAVRARVPGVCRLPHPRRPQRPGLQSLRRHALLRQQLPVQGALLQLAQLRGAGGRVGGVAVAARLAAQPRRDGAREGCDGEVHLLRAAHPRGPERGASRGPHRTGRRDRAGVRAVVPLGGHRVRRPARQDVARRPAGGGPARLPRVRGAQHQTGDHVPRPRRARRSGEGGGGRGGGDVRTMPETTTRAPERTPAPMSSDSVTRTIPRTLGNPGRGYYALLGSAVTLLAIGILCLLYLLRFGLGLAGYSMPTYWAVYITCFVFWVGIAHSGTLISAILFLFRSGWRTAVYRVAEVMTVFAVMTAGLFPLIHIGRQWFFYWLIPYPNERGLW